MSTVTYRHNNDYSYKKDGVKHVCKYDIIDGEKGLSFHFLKKVGDEDFQSINVRETDKDSFSVRIKKGETSEESEVNMVGLMKLVNANKDLKFVNEYLTKERGTYKGRKGAKRSSRKRSRKASKKGGRKASRKGSEKSSKRRSRKSQKGGKRRRSRKASKKASKKASRKSSRKGSKKSSKRRSRRRSRKGMKGGMVDTGMLL